MSAKRLIEAADEAIPIWRRANDSIAWVMLGMDRNKVRRLCFRNPRAKLRDQNPAFVSEVLDKLNSVPMNLAIWTDATSCIDVGDCLFIQCFLCSRPSKAICSSQRPYLSECILVSIPTPISGPCIGFCAPSSNKRQNWVTS